MPDKNSDSFLPGFLAGMLAGLAIGFLYAPASGRVTRE